MKRIYFFFFLLLAAGPLFAQDFSGVKICINPGHGGHDSDDRYIPLTGFWESEGNLTKGLYLRDILEGWGAEVIMSRTTNTSEDDLPLSQIAAIANNNNVDFFQSIHSNASSAPVNHPLMLFRGYTNDPVFPKAKQMGSIMFQELNAGHKWCVWEGDGENNVGDWSFYPSWGTQGLGVLRPLEMPGVLSEGSHHDHPMESWRLQNLQYRKHESWIFAKSYIRYFETAHFNLGEIVGTARDKNEAPEYFHLEKTADTCRPIDNMTFRLLPENQAYQGDTMNNGFFMFDSLQPGTYQVIYEHEDYFNDTAEVTVNANETSFADIYMQYDTTKTPVVTDFSPAASVDSVNSMAPVIMKFSEPMDSASVAEAFSAAPEITGTFSWEDNHRRMHFTPTVPYQKATDYTVTLAASAKQQWGVSMSDDFTLQFTSKYRNRYHLLAHYPQDGEEGVNPGMQFSLFFDAPVAQSSLLSNIVVLTEAGDTVAYENPKIDEINGMGVFRFSPAENLEANTTYRLHVKGQVSDENGNILYRDSIISFTAGEMPDPIGDVLMGFENEYTWSDPDDNAGTSGTDPNRTYFIHYGKPVIEGEYAGRLDYTFNAADARAELVAPAQKQIVNGMDLVTLWVYGDMSFNTLNLRAVNDDGETQTLSMDTLYRSGWHLCAIPQDSISLEGEVYLDALVLERSPDGFSKGTLYLDNLMTAMDLSTGLTNEKTGNLRLYPNPARDFLWLELPIPKEQTATFYLYDMQGKNLMRRNLSGKNNPVRLKLPDVPAGMYFYKLNGNKRYSGKVLIRD